MISIIVPVYNVEKYLSRCIQSIINQKYKDWELLLIDDGSKDDSGKICDDYASKDGRIKVYHKMNGGVSSARNKGLELVSGDYICFIDSDDWVDESYLSDFKVDDVQSDLYISGVLYDINDEIYSFKKYEEKQCTSIGDIKQEFFLQDLFSNGYPWGKIYNKKIIDNANLKFNELLSIHEDHLFVIQYVLQINSLLIVDKAAYHYLVIDSIDDNNRKLSGRTKKYEEFKMVSEYFDKLIYKLKYTWYLTDTEYYKLNEKFVFLPRLNALKSLILQRRYSKLNQEIDYWKKNKYSGTNKKDSLILKLIRSSVPFKFYLLLLFYSSSNFFYRNRLKKIYKDLDNRSSHNDN